MIEKSWMMSDKNIDNTYKTKIHDNFLQNRFTFNTNILTSWYTVE